MLTSCFKIINQLRKMHADWFLLLNLFQIYKQSPQTEEDYTLRWEMYPLKFKLVPL